MLGECGYMPGEGGYMLGECGYMLGECGYMPGSAVISRGVATINTVTSLFLFFSPCVYFSPRRRSKNVCGQKSFWDNNFGGSNISGVTFVECSKWNGVRVLLESRDPLWRTRYSYICLFSFTCVCSFKYTAKSLFYIFLWKINWPVKQPC